MDPGKSCNSIPSIPSIRFFVRVLTIDPVSVPKASALSLRPCHDMSMIDIETGKRTEALDITSKVSQALLESGIKSGICIVYSLHTTTALTINEADDALINDILSLLERIAPKGAGYEHDRGDGNAHAHLRAALLGNSATIPVEDGRLALGTWQRIIFLEFDGPRRRRIFVRIVVD